MSGVRLYLLIVWCRERKKNLARKELAVFAGDTDYELLVVDEAVLVAAKLGELLVFGGILGLEACAMGHRLAVRLELGFVEAKRADGRQ